MKKIIVTFHNHVIGKHSDERLAECFTGIWPKTADADSVKFIWMESPSVHQRAMIQIDSGHENYDGLLEYQVINLLHDNQRTWQVREVASKEKDGWHLR